MSCRWTKVVNKEIGTTITLQRMMLMDKPPQIKDMIISLRKKKHAKIRLWTTVDLSKPAYSKSLMITT